MAPTLPERIALARREQLDYASFLEIILSDEVNRRDHQRMDRRMRAAGFAEICLLEEFDWTASITLVRLDGIHHPCMVGEGAADRFNLDLLDKHEHVFFLGPAGVGKSFLAQTLGHADDFARSMAQTRVDNSVDRTFRSLLSPDLLVLDDFGLHKLTSQQSADLYELIIDRHRVSSFVITSNRSLEEWLSLFDDPILGNSALDRLANASYQIVIEDQRYRGKLSPHRKFLGARGGD